MARSINVVDDGRHVLSPKEHLQRITSLSVLAYRQIPEWKPRPLHNARERVRELAINLHQAIYFDIEAFVRLSQGHVERRQGLDTIVRDGFLRLCEGFVQHLRTALLHPEGEEAPPAAAMATADPRGDPGYERRMRVVKAAQGRKARPREWPGEHRTSDGAAHGLVAMDQQQLMCDLELLFDAMDPMAQGRVEWEAFFSYLMDASMQGHISAQPTPIKPYMRIEELGARRENEAIRSLKQVPGMELCVAAAERAVIFLQPRSLAQKTRYPPPIQVDGKVMAVEWTVDQRGDGQVVVGTNGLSMKLYHARTGTLQAAASLDSTMFCIHYNRSWETSLFTGSQSGQLVTWQLRDRQAPTMAGSVDLHGGPLVYCLQLPNNDGLITGGMDGTVAVYDPRHGKAWHKFSTGPGNGVRSMRYSQDFKVLGTTGHQLTPLLWIINGTSRQDPLPLKDEEWPHHHPLVAVDFVEGTPQALSLDVSGLVKIWDLRTFGCVQSVKSDKEYTKSETESHPFQLLAYLPSCKRIVTGTQRRLYSFQYNPASDGVPSVADDGSILNLLHNHATNTFLTVTSRNVRSWDVVSGLLGDCYDDIVPEPVTSICLDNQGRRFFVGTFDGMVHVYNHSNGIRLQSFKVASCEITSLTFIPPRSGFALLVACTYRGKLLVMAEETRHPSFVPLHRHLMHAEGIHDIDAKCMAYSESQRLLLVGDTQNFVSVLVVDEKLTAFRVLGQPAMPRCEDSTVKTAVQEVTALCFLEGHHMFACAETNGCLDIFSLPPRQPANQSLARFLPPHTTVFHGAVSCMAFCASPPTLWSGDDQGNVFGFDLGAFLEAATHCSPGERPLTSRRVGRSTAGMLPGWLPGDGDSAGGCTPRADVPTGRGPQPGRRKSSRLSNLPSQLLLSDGTPEPLNLDHHIRTIAHWRAHLRTVHAIEYLAQYGLLATASADRHVRLWTTDGTEVGHLEQANGSPFNLNDALATLKPRQPSQPAPEGKPVVSMAAPAKATAPAAPSDAAARPKRVSVDSDGVRDWPLLSEKLQAPPPKPRPSLLVAQDRGAESPAYSPSACGSPRITLRSPSASTSTVLAGTMPASQGKPKGVRPAMTSLAEPLPPPSSRALALAGGRPSPDKKALPLLDKEGEGFALDTMAFLYLSHDQKERLRGRYAFQQDVVVGADRRVFPSRAPQHSPRSCPSPSRPSSQAGRAPFARMASLRKASPASDRRAPLDPIYNFPFPTPQSRQSVQ